MLQCSTNCNIKGSPEEDDMSTTKKPANGPVSAAATEKTEVVETIANLYTTGVERLAEVQKNGVDLAAKQYADTLGAWKKIALTVPGAPAVFMLDLASSAFESYAGLRKGAIDLAVEQSHAVAGLVKEGARSATKAIEDTTAIVQQNVEQSVAEQKKALDNSVAQTKAAFQTAKQRFGLTGAQVDEASESFQRGVDRLVETQKQLLDIAATPFTLVH
jgi:hypothetical protein